MRAALPMHDWPHLRADTDQFWSHWAAALRANGIAAPESLSRDRPAEDCWNDPAMLVTQICGLPYVSGLCQQFRLVAIPHYRTDGCKGSRYRSVLAMHRNRMGSTLLSFAGGTVAISAWHSHSGHTALVGALHAAGGSLPFFDRALVTGSHAASMKAVADGRADLAAVDCVTWALAGDAGFPPREHLASAGMTPPAPGLPLVTRRDAEDGRAAILLETLQETLADPALATVCQRLRIRGATAVKDSAYDGIRELRRWAAIWPLAQTVAD